MLKMYRMRARLANNTATVEERDTENFDSQGMRYLAVLLTPLCIAGALYSLLYIPHKRFRKKFRAREAWPYDGFLFPQMGIAHDISTYKWAIVVYIWIWPLMGHIHMPYPYPSLDGRSFDGPYPSFL